MGPAAGGKISCRLDFGGAPEDGSVFVHLKHCHAEPAASSTIDGARFCGDLVMFMRASLYGRIETRALLLFERDIAVNQTV